MKNIGGAGLSLSFYGSAHSAIMNGISKITYATIHKDLVSTQQQHTYPVPHIDGVGVARTIHHDINFNSDFAVRLVAIAETAGRDYD